MMLVPVALFKISISGEMICCHVVLIMDTSKCFLLLKNNSVAGSTCFQGTGVNVCRDGCRYLGSAIGTDDFVC